MEKELNINGNKYIPVSAEEQKLMNEYNKKALDDFPMKKYDDEGINLSEDIHSYHIKKVFLDLGFEKDLINNIFSNVESKNAAINYLFRLLLLFGIPNSVDLLKEKMDENNVTNFISLVFGEKYKKKVE